MKTLARLLAIPALMLASCSSAPSPTSGGSDIRTNSVTGTVSTTLNKNLESSFKASKRAIEDMKFTPVTDSLDALKGVLQARTADGTTVDITVARQSDTLTVVEAGAGPLKTDVARALIAKIQERAVQ